MARIFSISFSYRDNTYTALINVQPTSLATEYHVTLLDDDLNYLLPGSKVISHTPGHYAFQNAGTGNEELMNALIKAVAGHVHSLTASPGRNVVD